jgi:photosystem II stability/assembly factor-like uncharacterized protein
MNKKTGCLFLWVFLLGAPDGRGAEEEKNEALLQNLTFRSIGPAVMGGRIDDLAVVESKPWIVYVGTASGGLWKTINNGTTWEPVTDRQDTSSIGDVTLAPSDPEIVWVGKGEPNNRQSSTFGDGVYKSLDGGMTWEHMGLRDTHHIGRIVIHPRNPDIVYVAALGHLWGANEERGVFKTTDGGKAWEKVLYIDEDTGVVDLAMDPVNPAIIYAAAYQRRRTPWGFNGGGPGSGLYKSTDGGNTWKKLSKGLPEGTMGRIGLGIYRKDPRIAYALIESREGGFFKSEDRGETWERVNILNPRPMYYSKFQIDPNDWRRIYILSSSFYVSDDGGENFRQNTEMTPTYDVGVHGDHHALWIDPANSQHLILGGDGGLYFSWDASTTWDKVNNIPLAQFYGIGVDMQQPYNVYAGAQDTHSWGGPSATRNHIGILNSDWIQINFGDGMFQRIDPTDPDVIYTESQGGNIVRFDRKTADMRAIRPFPPEGEDRYRFHWTSPILISPHDPKTIHLGGNRLFISKDQGENWTATPDLTRAEDRDELAIMGVVPDDKTLSRHDGTSNWGTITSVAESPLTPGLLWIGADDGSVQVSRDGGGTWTRLNGKFPGFDEHRVLVSRVAASHAAPGRAYVSFDRHRLDDFAPYIFTTDDFGESWRSISGGLPPAGWVNVIIEHPRNRDLLFVGTETGLFVSVDRGKTWTRMTGNFPTVPVDDLVIHPRDNDLVVGTHGRAIYILDDVTPLEQLTPDVTESPAHLFDVRAAYEYLPWKHESYGAQRQFIGENPPYGALLSYNLASEPEGDVSLSISDGAGNTLREIEGTKQRGMNRVVWDMRTAPPKGVPRGRGPLVPPGSYTVRLVVGEEPFEKPVEIKLDPRVDISTAELRERYDFLMDVGTMVVEIREASESSGKIIDQIEKLLKSEDVPETLQTVANEVLEKAKQIRTQVVGPGGRASFRNPSLQRNLGMLFSELDGDAVRQGTFHGPRQVQKERFAEYKSQAEEQLGLLNQLIQTSIPDLNRQITEAGLPWIRVQ